MAWDVTLRALLSLVLVLGLIAGAGVLVRRYGGQGLTIGRRGARRRLALVETLPLDNRRRLLLIRKDQEEHLLLVGGGCDLVIGSNPSGQPVFSLAEEEEAK